jgi:hypothetical protein
MNYAEMEQGKPLYRRTRNFYGGSHLTRRLFASMLRRILALPLPAG